MLATVIISILIVAYFFASFSCAFRKNKAALKDTKEYQEFQEAQYLRNLKIFTKSL